MTELAVSRRGRVRPSADRPSSRQPRVAKAGPPVTGLRYSSLVSAVPPGAVATSRRRAGEASCHVFRRTGLWWPDQWSARAREAGATAVPAEAWTGSGALEEGASRKKPARSPRDPKRVG